MAPVSCLHDEMLQFIFILASADNIFCRNDSLERRAETARHSAQVNQRWRVLAIQTPLIWLGPVLSESWKSSPDWVRIVLQRSSPLPLENVEIPPGITRENYSRIITEVSKVTRFRSLQISITPAFSAENVAVDFNEPAFLTHGRLPLNLMDNVDVGRPIRRLPVSSRYNFIPKTYRSVRDVTLSQSSSLPVIELLKALQSMECLEILRILRPFDDSPAEMSLDLPELPSNKLVNLRELKILTVTAPISTCACIIKNIRFQISCAVKLDCHLADVGPYLDQILMYIREVMPYWGCEPTDGGRQFLQMDASHFEYTLEGPKDNFESLDDVTYNHPDISLALCWPRSQSPEEQPTQKLVTLFFQVMSAFQICDQRPNTLDIEIDNDLPITLELQDIIFQWLESENHTIIQDLKFRTWTSLRLFEQAIRTDYVFPLLNGLIFYKMTFGSHLKRAWDCLLSYLDQRDECPVSAIEFIQCDFSNFDHVLRKASESVEYLAIDGREYKPYDDPMDEDSDGYASDDTIHGR
ncbi:hypothetical protein CVT25_008588 [Psilocybe cyanescens]|uniref:F-box domain-containing protein n=1 Tax=Psilocybe cyanescens TaxID=93625 RepID=A0A409XNH1_PSICY|nr:hypothetical protein CVT25_008588 [Psilocybe cyanescens]